MRTALMTAALAVAVGLAPAHAPAASAADAPRPQAQRQLDMGRTFGPETSGTVNAAPKVPKPRIITKAEWGGGESSGTMRAHRPTQLTLHHEGSAKPITADHDVPKALKGQQKYGWDQKGWADIPYHYMVDLNGNIYEARNPLMSGDTNTTYDPTGHMLVCVMGNFELQTPSEKQMASVAALMAWLSDVYNIDPATLRGHMDYTPTACPGKYLQPYVASGFLEGEIRRALCAAYLGLAQ